MLGRDGWAGLACLAVSLLLLAATRGLPESALVPIGPGVYPRFVLGIAAVLSALLVASDFLARGKRAARAPGTAPNYALVVAAFAEFFVYIVALPYLGFRIATFAFVLAFHALLEPPRGARRWALALVMAVVVALVSWFVFERGLSVLLPRGRWTDF
ncbi:MAG: tripartite tricarboxylate transporter TctB family protein [Burkholderiales bacterium]